MLANLTAIACNIHEEFKDISMYLVNAKKFPLFPFTSSSKLNLSWYYTNLALVQFPCSLTCTSFSLCGVGAIHPCHFVLYFGGLPYCCLTDIESLTFCVYHHYHCAICVNISYRYLPLILLQGHPCCLFPVPCLLGCPPVCYWNCLVIQCSGASPCRIEHQTLHAFCCYHDCATNAVLHSSMSGTVLSFS